MVESCAIRKYCTIFCLIFLLQLALALAQDAELDKVNTKRCAIDCNGTFANSSNLGVSVGVNNQNAASRRLPQVCASDGHTYESRCAMLWHKQCRGLRLKIQHQGPCENNTEARCEERRQEAKRQRRQERRITTSGNAGESDKVHVPRCNADGTFAKIQCAATTDSEQCWCAELDGRPVISSLVSGSERPKCNGATVAATNNCTAPSTITAFMRHVLVLLESDFREQTEARLPPTFGSNRNGKPNRLSKDAQLVDRIPLIITRTNDRVSLDGSQPARHWKFAELDKTSDDQLNQAELRNFEWQLFLQFLDPSIRELISCVNNVSSMCDSSGDGVVNRTEWDDCFGAPNAALASVPQLNDSSETTFSNRTNPDTSVGRAKSCRDARKEAQEFNRNVRHETTQFVPKCDSTNAVLYQQVQCHAYARNSTFCWCVDSRNGVQVGRATILTRKDGAESINCSAAALKPFARPTNQPVLLEPIAIDETRDFRGCPDNQQGVFLNILSKQLIAEMNQVSIGNRTKVKQDVAALRWKIGRLDKNRNGVLDRNEWKPLRNLLSRSGKPALQKCMRNFPKYCDADDNQALTFDELLQCSQFGGNGAQNPRDRTRYETNPLTILKP